MAVLDNFHFNLSSVTTEDVQALKPHPPTDSAGKAPPDIETAARGDQVENAMEVDESSSAPSNKDEGMSKASAKKILKAIICTIIPSLQKVLTKRVS